MDDLDRALSNLANAHRRQVLLTLLDHGSKATEEVFPSTDAHAGATEHEEIQMYHAHLPKLDEAGFITWHREDQRVLKGPKFDEIRPLVELLVDNADELPGREIQA